jgi:hypothetical protein
MINSESCVMSRKAEPNAEAELLVKIEPET